MGLLRQKQTMAMDSPKTKRKVSNSSTKQETKDAEEPEHAADWKSYLLPSMSIEILLEHLLDNLDDVIVGYRRKIGTDGSPVYSLMNKKGQTVVGKTPHEILGQTNVQLFGETPFAVEMDQTVKKCCDTRTSITIQHEVGRVFFESTYTYQKSGKYEYALGLCRDVTERVNALKTAESLRVEAEKATQTKSLFLARMSHDLRTPLMGVLNTADLLGMTKLDEEQDEQVGVIKASGQVLLALSNGITDLSRVEEGKLQFNSETMDLENCLKLTRDFCSYRAEEAGVNLSFLYDQELSTKLRQDTTRLRQIVYNVLFNAIKFTPPGGSVSVDVKSIVAPPNLAKKKLPEFLTGGTEGPPPQDDANSSIQWVQIDVTDTGVGIPEEMQKKIFQPFSQVPNAKPFGGSGSNSKEESHHDCTPSEERGAGLGLAISSGLSKALGGELSLAYSTTQGPNTGSRFRINLPFGKINLPRTDIDEAEPSLIQDEAIEERVSNLKVLIADDHPINRKILKRLIEVIGVKEILVVCDGVEAVEAFEKADHGIDIVLMDVHMPNMDGITAVNKIRKIVPESHWPYVTMLTADAMTSDIDDCYARCSPNDYLTKPIRQNDLIKCLHDTVLWNSERI